MVELGETAKADLSFLNPLEHIEKIKVDMAFELHEEFHLIENGIVTIILKLPDNARKNDTTET